MGEYGKGTLRFGHLIFFFFVSMVKIKKWNILTLTYTCCKLSLKTKLGNPNFTFSTCHRGIPPEPLVEYTGPLL